MSRPTLDCVIARPERVLYAGFKRGLDVMVALPLLLVTAPVLAIVLLLVRVRLGAPALYRTVRAGRWGAPIRIVKVRTMTNEMDAHGVPLPDEARLTYLGRRLREWSLDEIPQLWQVLAGRMTLVGPRPLPIAYVDRYSAEQRRRLDAKPGLTGWAQVNGRNGLSWPDKLVLDVWYIDHASIWLDLRILVRTMSAVVGRRGVSADDHVTMPEFRGEH